MSCRSFETGALASVSRRQMAMSLRCNTSYERHGNSSALELSLDHTRSPPGPSHQARGGQTFGSPSWPPRACLARARGPPDHGGGDHDGASEEGAPEHRGWVCNGRATSAAAEHRGRQGSGVRTSFRGAISMRGGGGRPPPAVLALHYTSRGAEIEAERRAFPARWRAGKS